MRREISRRLQIGLVGALGLLLAPAHRGHAQQGPLVADRPDFTEAAATVGRGVLQIEFGYTLERRSGDEAWTHSLGESLFRAGILADWLELRLGLSPVSQRMRGDVRETGLEDLYLGMKFALARQAGFRPLFAVITQMTLPTGSAAFSSDRHLPGVNLIYAWDLTDEVSLAGSTQVNRAVSESGAGYAEWAQSLVTGRALGARAGLYAEWFAFFHAEPGDAWCEHYANGGFTWSVTDDVQWDIRLGAGLNEEAQDFFAGTGLAIRFR